MTPSRMSYGGKHPVPSFLLLSLLFIASAECMPNLGSVSSSRTDQHLQLPPTVTPSLQSSASSSSSLSSSSSPPSSSTHQRLKSSSEPELLAESFGYPCETHEVVTEDGYVLTIHRVPTGKKGVFDKKKKRSRPVALLLHGFLASSDSWLFRGPDKDLPYVLADAGYDVWVCNSRGNVFSRSHVTLDPDNDLSFWNFSIHEYGVYDLPATIDYALRTTNQTSLHFLGHSIGATAFFIMCSLRPEYNSKIKLANALAPAAIISHTIPGFTKFLLSLIPPIMGALKNQDILEVFPQKQIFTRIGKYMCVDGLPTQQLCLLLMFAAVGTDYEQFNHTMFPTALTYYPAGTSVDVLIHVHQIFSGHFGPLNSNEQTYNLKKVTAPVALHYGDGDAMISKEDNIILASKLSNPIGVFRVPYHNFNHIDFMWSTDSKILLYDHLVALMNKYR